MQVLTGVGVRRTLGVEVSVMGRRMMRVGNRIGVWMYRTLDARLARGIEDVHVLTHHTRLAQRRTAVDVCAVRRDAGRPARVGYRVGIAHGP